LLEETQLSDLVIKSRHLTYFRLAFASIILSFALFIQRYAAQELDPVGLVTCAFVVLTCNLLALAALVLMKSLRRWQVNLLNGFLVTLDIGALSFVVHFTEGVESELFFLYLLPILFASNVFEKVGIYTTALAASLAYLATVVSENSSFIPFIFNSSNSSSLTAAYAQRLWLQVGSRSATLFFVALIWAAFCHRMSAIVLQGSRKLAEQLTANTLLIVELQAQAKREQLSNSISLALRRTLDLDSILSTTCSALSVAMGAENCLIASKAGSTNEAMVWDSAVISGKNEKSFLPDEIKNYLVEHPWQRKPDDEPLNKILLRRAPFADEDIAAIKTQLQGINCASLLLRPIMYGTNLKGVLAIFSRGIERHYLPSELELIDTVAGQVAIAIEQAELVTKLHTSNKDLLVKNQNLDAKNLEMKEMQSQLIHQEKMASLGRIVAGIAHELNNPINFVHGNLPYLKQYFGEMKQLIDVFEELPEEYRIMAETAKRKINYDFVLTDLENIIADLFEGTDRIRQIIRNLRSFSRLDEADLKEASIEEGIESTIKLLNQYYGRDKIQIELNFCRLPPILCYPGKLNQVWMNLLSNAAQAIANKQDGLVKVQSQLENEHVIISIEDNGTGIKSSDQSRIFEPFFTTKAVGQGTGLGLSISHSIVDRHGGQIWFESLPGQGTKFIVRLPLAPPPDGHESEELALREHSSKAKQ